MTPVLQHSKPTTSLPQGIDAKTFKTRARVEHPSQFDIVIDEAIIDNASQHASLH